MVLHRFLNLYFVQIRPQIRTEGRVIYSIKPLSFSPPPPTSSLLINKQVFHNLVQNAKNKFLGHSIHSNSEAKGKTPWGTWQYSRLGTVEKGPLPMTGVKRLSKFPFKFHFTSLPSKLHSATNCTVLQKQQTLSISPCYLRATDIISALVS